MSLFLPLFLANSKSLCTSLNPFGFLYLIKWLFLKHIKLNGVLALNGFFEA